VVVDGDGDSTKDIPILLWENYPDTSNKIRDEIAGKLFCETPF